MIPKSLMKDDFRCVAAGGLECVIIGGDGAQDAARRAAVHFDARENKHPDERRIRVTDYDGCRSHWVVRSTAYSLRRYQLTQVFDVTVKHEEWIEK